MTFGPRPSAMPSRRRRPLWPWVAAGAGVGALAALVAAAPASWAARALAGATNDRFVLADARGSVWAGSAVAVLAGGAGSQTASALPGRLSWTLRPERGFAWRLALAQPCCLDGGLELVLRPGIGRLRIEAPAGSRAFGQWPVAWLGGLGAPFNTLRLGGALRLVTHDLALESAQGRWRLAGRAELDVLGLSSALTTLDALGSYRVAVAADETNPEGARLTLGTLQGPLELSGQGQWTGPRLHFRGEARAQPGREAMLNNVLNLLGPRRGDVALLAIG